MDEFKRKPAHAAVPNWQAPTSTGKPAGHRGVARWSRAVEGKCMVVINCMKLMARFQRERDLLYSGDHIDDG